MLNQKLAAIQIELKVPKSLKADKYRYRNGEQILEAVKPLLKGLSLILSDEVVNVGTRNYVKSTARLSDGVVAVDATAYAHEENRVISGGQLTGASSSYARKYALCGLFAIDSGEDLDDIPTTPVIKKEDDDIEYGDVASAEQMKTIQELGGNETAILKYFNRPFLTTREAKMVIAGLRRKKDVQKV
jgi:hypothetical protein